MGWSQIKDFFSSFGKDGRDRNRGDGDFSSRGEWIVEGSTHPTYLVYDDSLMQMAQRLSVLDVTVEYGRTLESDLVNDIFLAMGQSSMPKLTQVMQYLASRTLERICGYSDEDIKGKRYALGGMNAESLMDCPDIRSYMKFLLGNYPTYEELVPEFESTAFVGRDFSGQTFDDERLQAMMAEQGTTVGSEASPKNRFDLMMIMTHGFASIGQEISYPRMQYINPFIPALAMAPEDRRNTVLGKMLDKEYPFNPENKEHWGFEIQQAGGID